MSDREHSDIEVFQYSGKGIPLFMTGHKKIAASRLHQWVAYPLFSKLSEIVSML